MVKDHIKSFSYLIPVLLLLVFSSCATSYNITKSNRAEYAINKDVAPDSSIIKTYLPYKAQMEAEMNQVVGHSTVLMSKVESDKNPESLLSNFFADAALDQALKKDTNIDFAMPSTKGGLRVDIPAGEVKMSHLFETMPFENQLIIYTLKGADVQNLVDFIAAANGEPVARLKMKIVDKKAVDVLINGKAFDASKTYKVLTTDYIAGGGDNVQSFKNPIDKKVLGLKVRDALINYVKELEATGKTISPRLDGRITK